MGLRPRTLSRALYTLFLASLIKAQNGCYYPNGNPSADIPCDSSAPVSMCCGSRSSCLSSGLCLIDGTSATSGISYARGTCTDPTWKSPFCPQHCQLSQETARGNTSAYDFRAGGVQVWECVGEGYAEPAAYCCESISEKTRCCQTAEAVFSLPGATIGNAASVQTFVGVGGSTLSQTRTSTAPSSTSGSSTGTSSTPESKATTEDPTRTGTGDSSRSTAGLPEASTGGGGLSREARLGVAIAIPLVAVAVLAVLVLLWYRKKQAANAATVSNVAQSRPGEWHKAELDGNGVPVGAFPNELDSNNEVKELGPGAMITGLPGGVHGLVTADSAPGYGGSSSGNQPAELDTQRRR